MQANLFKLFIFFRGDGVLHKLTLDTMIYFVLGASADYQIRQSVISLYAVAVVYLELLIIYKLTFVIPYKRHETMHWVLLAIDAYSNVATCSLVSFDKFITMIDFTRFTHIVAFGEWYLFCSTTHDI